MSSIYDSLSKADSVKTPSENIHLNIPKNPQIIKPAKSKTQPSQNSSRFAVYTAVFVALLALGGAVYCFLGLLSSQQRQQSLETRYQQLMGFSQSLEARTSEYRKEIEQVRNQLQTLSTDKTDIQKEVSRSRIEISNLEKRVMDVQERSRKLDQEVQGLIQDRQRQSLGNETSSGRLPAATPVSFEPVIQQPVNAASASVPPEASVAVSASSEGTPAVTTPQVMTINRKFNFVVVNIGMKDKLKMGDRLRIERNGKSVGTVEIEKLYDSFSAATIIDEKKNQPIQEGDSVVKA